MSTGLTLGKFAPLHKGHQLLIETSIEENDKTIVIVYDSPDVISIPLETRANWIRKLYPGVKVLLAFEAPQETGTSERAKRLQEDYVLSLLQGEKIDAFYSSEFYGEHMSQALGAIDRRIDEARIRHSVSGTDIRRAPRQFIEQISPDVYPDLVTRICLLGGPSTGKTTLAERLAQEYETEWMPEYGREYWEKHQVDRRLTLEQLVELAEGHIAKENTLLRTANRYLFCDTNAITTLMFSIYYHGEALPELHRLASQCVDRYDLFVLCDSDFAFDDTWDRSGAASRDALQNMTMMWLADHSVPYEVVSGTVSERVLLAGDALTRIDRLSPAI